MKTNEKTFVDEKELDIAEEEAIVSGMSYTHKFKKPFEFEGKTYTTLTFDWGNLTGRDALAIENELQSLGKAVIVPQFSGEYLIRMAAKACEQPIAADAFEFMGLGDYNKIRAEARSFLIKSEL